MRNAAVGVRRLFTRLRTGLKTRPSAILTASGGGGIARLRGARLRLTAAIRPAIRPRSVGSTASARPRDPRRTHGSGAHPIHPSGGRLRRVLATAAVLRAAPRATIGRFIPNQLPRERLIPIGVAALLLVASAFSVAGGAPAAGGTGSAQSGGTPPRIAIGGPTGPGPAVAGTIGSGLPESIDGAPIDAGLPVGSISPFAQTDPSLAPKTGPFLADGTLLMPVAVDTTVADGSSKLTNYTVRSGDTLTGIANHFGVSMMSIWWANKLTSKDELHIGQVLVIPPVSGLVLTVANGDTLATIAARTGVPADEIVTYNGLRDRNLVIGQKLILPGAVGKAIPTPKPIALAASGSSGGGGGGVAYRPAPASYAGGTFAWPVPGGFISQYFWWGHQALDIAASYGSPILAAAAGVVIWAGYRNNEGGYQVWISHGSGLYTGYYHMSSIGVGVGEQVGRGSEIGRIGTSGVATGPHCHFEVWRGYPWASGSYRVNPLGYL
ncbi:MAG: M23 family metallopeptidase [Chloroflexi bacterium]|nr:M23 family metallopeptidase [Chloroflexota bacterium]